MDYKILPKNQTMDVGTTLQMSLSTSLSYKIVRWQIEPVFVAIISPTGLVRARQPGQAKIAAIVDENILVVTNLYVK